MTSSIQARILQNIQHRKGKIIFATDFLDYGEIVSIRQALSRLTKEGELVRLANGIYLSPKRDPDLGILFPSIEEVAVAIARRDKARIRPTGIFALHKLGLSTQIPMKVTYLTDGSPRKIKIGNRTLTFKATAPKNLSLKGEISSLVIQALRELGPKGLTDSLREIILRALQQEDKEILRNDTRLAPAWIRTIIFSLMSTSHD